VASGFHMPHLSTGDMFRDHIGRTTDLGRQAKPLMERGELVPDGLVLGMVEDRISQPDCKNGFVFDGFPRTVTQADDLERICQDHGFLSTKVLHLVVSQDLLMRRLTGRRICTAAGHIYNIYERPPRREGVCDEDGSELIHRRDDTETVITGRLAAYGAQTRPLVDYYRTRGVLSSVDAMVDADEVTTNIMKVLDGAKVTQ
jgi:adenylate kinase